MKVKQTSRRIGLARALSKLGYCSRTKAAELIRSGHVHLNDKLRRDPETPVRLENDHITVDGKPIKARTKVYLMLNKPSGLVTTASDEKGRETVYAVLRAAMSAEPQEQLPWVAPVGRLDKGSEGLILLTNDSEWAARVTAPETHLDKTYHVQIDMVVDEEWTQSLIRGVRCEGVGMLRAKHARVLRSGQKNCWLEIILDEGKNRQIRNMLAARGAGVLRLVRVSIGPLQLGNLAKSTFRELTEEEKDSLDRAMAAKETLGKPSLGRRQR